MLHSSQSTQIQAFRRQVSEIRSNFVDFFQLSGRR